MTPHSLPPRTPCDLLVLWEWEYDADFIQLLARHCAEAHLELHAIGSPDALALAELQQAPEPPALLLDRASDRYPEMIPVLETLKEKGVRVVNDAVWHLHACCSVSPTSCCSTNLPTTSTLNRWAGWNNTCKTSPALSSL